MSHSARMHFESSASATGAASSARHRAFSSTLHRTETRLVRPVAVLLRGRALWALLPTNSVMHGTITPLYPLDVSIEFEKVLLTRSKASSHDVSMNRMAVKSRG
jgi:hypothetical protein